MNIKEFNIDVDGTKLAPIAKSYNQTITLFWSEVDNAIFYRIKLYFMDIENIEVDKYLGGDVDIRRSHMGKVIVSVADLNNDKNRNHLAQVQIGNACVNLATVYVIRRIGYRKIYKIADVIIGDNQKYYSFTNMIPSKYILIITAEDKSGNIISRSKGIDIDLIGIEAINPIDGRAGITRYNKYTVITSRPKDWNENDYFIDE
jgi:hypothetical protein